MGARFIYAQVDVARVLGAGCAREMSVLKHEAGTLTAACERANMSTAASRGLHSAATGFTFIELLAKPAPGSGSGSSAAAAAASFHDRFPSRPKRCSAVRPGSTVLSLVIMLLRHLMSSTEQHARHEAAMQWAADTHARHRQRRTWMDRRIGPEHPL
jgi:hypothetical protein